MRKKDSLRTTHARRNAHTLSLFLTHARAHAKGASARISLSLITHTHTHFLHYISLSHLGYTHPLTFLLTLSSLCDHTIHTHARVREGERASDRGTHTLLRSLSLSLTHTHILTHTRTNTHTHTRTRVRERGERESLSRSITRALESLCLSVSLTHTHRHIHLSSPHNTTCPKERARKNLSQKREQLALLSSLSQTHFLHYLSITQSLRVHTPTLFSSHFSKRSIWVSLTLCSLSHHTHARTHSHTQHVRTRTHTRAA